MTVIGFTAGNGAGADRIGLANNNTTANNNNAIPQFVAAPGNVTFTTATADLLVLDFNATASDLSTANNGAALLTALGGTITVSANGDKGYILAYDNGHAYLYYAADTGDSSLAAGEIALIGVIENVAVSSLVAANFVIQ